MFSASVVIQMLLAAFVLYSCWCRLVFTNSQTRLFIRWSIWLKAVAAGLVFGAPVWPAIYPARFEWPVGQTPDWVWIFLLVAVVLSQASQSTTWGHGVPCIYQGDAK